MKLITAASLTLLLIVALGVPHLAFGSVSKSLTDLNTFARNQGLANLSGSGPCSVTPTASYCLLRVIIRIIRFMLFIIGALAVGGVVYGGLQYILAVGDESKVSRAKGVILYSLTGLSIAAVAGVLVLLVLFFIP